MGTCPQAEESSWNRIQVGLCQTYHADGSFKHNKACLITQGFNQHPGFEYLDIFTPTMHLSTLCIVLALAVIYDLYLLSVDISYAYLNGEINCKVYMEQPEGFVEGDPQELVCLLQKAHYGTKQGGNRWNHKMCTVLESMGFSQTYSDAAVYVYVKGDICLILPVFVNDMTFAFQSLKAIKDTIQQLQKHFKVHNPDPTREILGIKIDRDRSKHSLTILLYRYAQLLHHDRLQACHHSHGSWFSSL